MVLSGVYGDKFMFSSMVTRRDEEAIKDLKHKFGANYFKTSVMIHAVFQATSIACSAKGDAINATLCGRALALTALEHELLRGRGRDEIKNSWARHCGAVLQPYKDAYTDAKAAGNQDDQLLCAKTLLQSAGGFNAVIEGALISYCSQLDSKEIGRADAAKTISALTIVGVGLGISFITHCPAPMAAALPIIDQINRIFIERVFPVHNYAKAIDDAKLARDTASQALALAKIQDPDGTIRSPTLAEAHEIESSFDAYDRAEDAFLRIFAKHP